MKKFILYYFHALIIVILKTRINTGNVCRQVGHFCGTWCQGSRMIDNCSFNLGEFYVKMGKTNRNLQNYKERIHIMEGRLIAFVIWVIIGVLFIVMGIYDFNSKKAKPFGFGQMLR